MKNLTDIVNQKIESIKIELIMDALQSLSQQKYAGQPFANIKEQLKADFLKNINDVFRKDVLINSIRNLGIKNKESIPPDIGTQLVGLFNQIAKKQKDSISIPIYISRIMLAINKDDPDPRKKATSQDIKDITESIDKKINAFITINYPKYLNEKGQQLVLQNINKPVDLPLVINATIKPYFAPEEAYLFD